MPLNRRVLLNWFERGWNPRAALVEKKRKLEKFDAEEESKENNAASTTKPEDVASDTRMTD